MLKANRELIQKIRLVLAWATGILVALVLVLLSLAFFEHVDSDYYAEGESLPELVALVVAALSGGYVGLSIFHRSFSSWLGTKERITLQEWILGLTAVGIGLAWLAPRAFHTQPQSTLWLIASVSWAIIVVFFFTWRATRRKQEAQVRADLTREETITGAEVQRMWEELEAREFRFYTVHLEEYGDLINERFHHFAPYTAVDEIFAWFKRWGFERKDLGTADSDTSAAGDEQLELKFVARERPKGSVRRTRPRKL